MLMSVKRKRKKFIPVLIIIISVFILFLWAIVRLGPVYTEYAASYVYSRANSILAKSINDYCINNNVEYEKFISIISSTDKKVSAVETDATSINRFKSQITSEIENIMLNEFDGYVRIPIGSILSSPLFSNFGPKLKFKVFPIGRAEINISNSFSDAGINQVCHSLYLDAKVTYGITNSVFTHNETVDTRYLIGETVIVGDVPKFYGSGAIMKEGNNYEGYQEEN